MEVDEDTDNQDLSAKIEKEIKQSEHDAD